MAPTWKGERRTSTRRRAEVKFLYRFRGTPHETTLRDTSETGAFLVSEAELPSRGSTLLLEARIPARPKLLFRFVVEVVWVRPANSDGKQTGMGIRWRRAYCNQGAAVLRAFVKQQLHFELKASSSLADRPSAVQAEVLYDFESRRIKLRAPSSGPLAGYYRRPTSHSAMLVQDLPSEAPSPSTDEKGPTEKRSDDVRRVWRAFGGSPPPPTSRSAAPPPPKEKVFSQRPAVPQTVPPTESLRPVGAFQPKRKVGLTFSLGTVHFPGHALRVGDGSMRIATMEPPPDIGTTVLVRIPVPVAEDFAVVAIKAIATGGRVGGASGGANVFEVLFQEEKPGDIPASYRAFVENLRKEAGASDTS